MSSKFILILLLLNIFTPSYHYPIFPTVLTLSIPFKYTSEENRMTTNGAKVSNNYVRFLQASGSDIIAIHPWTSNERIDELFKKVNGVLLQGYSEDLQSDSAYYLKAKYLYNKVIELNKNGIKMPLLVVGDDIPLVCGFIDDNKDLQQRLKNTYTQTSNLIRNFQPDNTLILSELEKTDMEYLDNENVLSNNLNKYIPAEAFKKSEKLNKFYDLVATSKFSDDTEYCSIIESKDYPISLISFHPEFAAFDNSKKHELRETLGAIKSARFMGNAFVFYGRRNVKVTMTIEEKEKYDGYIDPYGKLPELVDGEYYHIFKNK